MNNESKQFTRNNFRATVSADILVAVVEEGKKIPFGSITDVLPLPDQVNTGDPLLDRVLASFSAALYHIDEKLNRILEKIEGSEKTGREIQVFDTVDISGSGISLVLSEKPETGSMIRLSILLPDYPYGRFDVTGRVVRSVERKNKEGRSVFLTGVEFTELGEKEKDRLIQYTFQQERKKIRNSEGIDGKKPL